MRASNDLCSTCSNNPECQRCKRRLPPGLFVSRSEICETCLRKLQDGRHRSALDGVVMEYQLPTSEFDGDLDAYINSHIDSITDLLQNAIDRHT
jgi:hypothetical protein